MRTRPWLLIHLNIIDLTWANNPKLYFWGSKLAMNIKRKLADKLWLYFSKCSWWYKHCITRSFLFIFDSKLPVRGLPGVPGENVPLHVVEELMNVIECVQTRPQATEDRTVSGLQLLHITATAIIVQVRVDVLLQRKPTSEHTRLHPCKDAIKQVLSSSFQQIFFIYNNF